MRRAVFLDRDGTINREVHYLSDPAQFELLAGAGAGLRRLADAGLLLVVVTNQSGIARGYFGEQDLAAVHARMEEALAEHGVTLAGVYCCSSLPGDGDPDRKPGTGMIERAAAELDIDLAGSWLIGDKTADVLAGRNAGLRTVLVKTGYGGSDGTYAVQPDAIAEDLAAAAEIVLARPPLNGGAVVPAEVARRVARSGGRPRRRRARRFGCGLAGIEVPPAAAAFDCGRGRRVDFAVVGRRLGR